MDIFAHPPENVE